MAVAFGEGMLGFVQADALTVGVSAWFPDGHRYRVRALKVLPVGLVVVAGVRPADPGRGASRRRVPRVQKAQLTINGADWVPILVPWET